MGVHVHLRVFLPCIWVLYSRCTARCYLGTFVLWTVIWISGTYTKQYQTLLNIRQHCIEYLLNKSKINKPNYFVILNPRNLYLYLISLSTNRAYIDTHLRKQIGLRDLIASKTCSQTKTTRDFLKENMLVKSTINPRLHGALRWPRDVILSVAIKEPTYLL